MPVPAKSSKHERMSNKRVAQNNKEKENTEKGQTTVVNELNS